MRGVLLCVAFWLLLISSAFPFSGSNITNILAVPEVPVSRLAFSWNNLQFRICPLGASIVNGYRSTDGNGFRDGLRKQLIADGARVNMIGSLKTGAMVDNDNEGWIGYVIAQTFHTADYSIPSQPNVILLHVGSNDMTADDAAATSTAHLRLATIIDKLFDSIPGVTIIASTLLPRIDPTINARTQIYNGNIPGVVQQRQRQGKKILYVDFSSSWFSIADIRADDGLHPTDAGYLKMATVWNQGIQLAHAQGWLTPPNAVPGL